MAVIHIRQCTAHDAPTLLLLPLCFLVHPTTLILLPEGLMPSMGSVTSRGMLHLRG